MKQILPELKELNKHLNFSKKCVTKSGFRHMINYINGLIAINHKTVKQISLASIYEKNHNGIDYILNKAKFDTLQLEERYLKKLKYLFRKIPITLVFDDTIVERNGKHIQEAQYHHDHCTNGFTNGHQYFTAILRGGPMVMPLFPQLYSKKTSSKIEMARDLVDNLYNKIPIKYCLFDSWYSDKQLIRKLMTHNINVICPIKTNRNVCFEKWKWIKLSVFTRQKHEFKNYVIDENCYNIVSYRTKLEGLPFLKMLISKEWNDQSKTWNDHFHLISTNTNLNVVQIIRKYSQRWLIEVFHRDVKQNLGFDKLFLRNRIAIVRHAILSVLAYAIMKLYMFQRKLQMTIGKCCQYIQGKETDDFIREIIEIDDKKERISTFEMVFIRKTAKV